MIPVFDKKSIEAVKEILSSPKKIVITTHHKPDGDAIGSSLALYNFLILKKHKVKVISPNDYPVFLSWMKGNDKITDFEKKKRVAEKIIADAEVIFCLDFNDPKRVELVQPALEKSKAVKILIDHHLEPKDFCTYTFSFADACATCELIYHFIDQLGEIKLLNKEIAECIYAGIMTDTGSFRFNSMTADTHRIIASLIEKGVNNAKIHENIYDTYSEDRARFLGFCLKDKLQVLPLFNVAMIAISLAELEHYNNKTGDTEGIVNYPLSINGIKLAALFIEREDDIKISFRSKGNFSVKELAKKYFNGGGHRNAAGGKSDMSLDETVDKFISVLDEYKEDLNRE